MYLSDLIAETKVNATIEHIRQQLLKQDFDQDQIVKIVKDIKYKLYGKLGKLSQSLTEPLIVNQETDWDTWMYEGINVVTLNVTNSDWDFDLHVAICKNGDGYVLHTFTIQTSLVQLQTFFFDKDLIMNRIMVWEARTTTEHKLISPRGTNCQLDSHPQHGTSALIDPHHYDSVNGSSARHLQIFTKREL